MKMPVAGPKSNASCASNPAGLTVPVPIQRCRPQPAARVSAGIPLHNERRYNSKGEGWRSLSRRAGPMPCHRTSCRRLRRLLLIGTPPLSAARSTRKPHERNVCEDAGNGAFYDGMAGWQGWRHEFPHERKLRTPTDRLQEIETEVKPEIAETEAPHGGRVNSGPPALVALPKLEEITEAPAAEYHSQPEMNTIACVIRREELSKSAVAPRPAGATGISRITA